MRLVEAKHKKIVGFLDVTPCYRGKSQPTFRKNMSLFMFKVSGFMKNKDTSFFSDLELLKSEDDTFH
jgi:hypothetical protein